MQNSQSPFPFGLKQPMYYNKLFSPTFYYYHDYMMAWFKTFYFSNLDRSWFFHFHYNMPIMVPRMVQYFFVQSLIFFLIKSRMVLTSSLASKKTFVLLTLLQPPYSNCVGYVWIMFILMTQFYPTKPKLNGGPKKINHLGVQDWYLKNFSKSMNQEFLCSKSKQQAKISAAQCKREYKKLLQESLFHRIIFKRRSCVSILDPRE